MRIASMVVVVLGLLLGTGLGGTGPEPLAAEEDALPEGPGLAAGYPGDARIERARGVLLAESFEKGTIQDLKQRWSEVKNPGGTVLRFVESVPEGASGKRALEMTATVGENTGGHLYGTYEGQDTVFVRFYVEFLDAEYIHHFVHVGGYRPLTRWPQGHAGEKPEGHERFTVGIEPHGQRGRQPAPGVWTFYTYWHEMKVSADGRHWGNSLLAIDPPPVPLRRWQCVEVMVKLNSEPRTRDGALALWLDGRLQAHFVRGARRGPWSGMGFQLRKQGGDAFEGFDWRTDTRLKADFFTLSLYVTEGAMRRNGVQDPSGRKVRVLFDNIVVADRYVGPLRARKTR